MKDNEFISQPRIVSSHDIQIDVEYAEWIAEVKHRYRAAQVKASVKVNAEKLQFNWALGRDLVNKKTEERWGSGVVEQVSLDLCREFPGEEGFSAPNLWFMKKWYLFYSSTEAQERLYQIEGELGYAKLLQPVREISDKKLLQPVRELKRESSQQTTELFPAVFGFVPWGHHITIISKCKSVEEALFYICKTIEQGMSRAALVNCIKSKLYEHQGKIVNNFAEHLPQLQSKLVQEVLKENYDFGFATVKHEIYDERELEDALSKNITDLLLELGTGFAFIGRQKELIAGDATRRIDLLFYHIRLRCYIVCELKARAFEPEFAGKLNFYVNVVDDLLKTQEDKSNDRFANLFGYG